MKIVVYAITLDSVSGGSPHHASAAYDNSKLVVLKSAIVTKVNWGNPHTVVLFDVKDDKGSVVHWVAEGGGASAVSTSGWTNAIQPGNVITVYLYQVKNGAPIGRTGKVVLADGTVFGSGELQGDRASQCDKDFGPGGNESAACRPDGRKTTNKEQMRMTFPEIEQILCSVN